MLNLLQLKWTSRLLHTTHYTELTLLLQIFWPQPTAENFQLRCSQWVHRSRKRKQCRRGIRCTAANACFAEKAGAAESRRNVHLPGETLQNKLTNWTLPFAKKRGGKTPTISVWVLLKKWRRFEKQHECAMQMPDLLCPIPWICNGTNKANRHESLHD